METKFCCLIIENIVVSKAIIEFFQKKTHIRYSSFDSTQYVDL